MIRLKRLSKTYRSKGGTSVKALDDVSLDFAERGMVFVLGKSGSGKSTLLNLIGGLDVADGGEIIIDGKSSKYYREADYDSYRNTYIGFIFQEYNLLDEFTVGENVSLALELQGQKADKQKIEEILKQVDLEGYAGRKINELSGGQKQRVAIARAIVKDPKIIMADEPTGALDSATGRAILDVLKDLSKDRLVIVVSHDREFAEQYADRIIELADGKVISDEVKTAPPLNQEEANRSLIKSRLPYARAFRMGAKSLFLKPIRLVFTIILCLVSFSFFALADTISAYNASKTAVSALAKSSSGSIALSRTYGALDEDIRAVKQATGLDVLGVACIDHGYQSLPLVYYRKVNSVYYNQSLYGYLPADKVIDGDEYKLIAGRLPEQADEIVVTKYTYEQFALGGLSISDGSDTVYVEPEELSTPQDFLDRVIQFSDGGIDVAWRVVGIVDTHADPDGRYERFKPDGNVKELTEEQYEYLSAECEYYFVYSYHSLGFVSEQAYEAIVALDDGEVATGVRAQGSYSLDCVGDDGLTVKVDNSFEAVANVADLSEFDVVWADGVARNSLADNEFVVSIEAVRAIGNAMRNKLRDTKIVVDRRYFDGLVDFSALDNLTYGYIEYISLAVGACEYAQRLSKSDLAPFIEYINNIASDMQDEEVRLLCRGMAISGCIDGINSYFVDEDYALDFYADDFSLEDWQIIYAGYLMSDKLELYGMTDEVVLGGYGDNVVAGQPCGREIAVEWNRIIQDEILVEYALNLRISALAYDFIFSDVERVTYDNSPTIVGVILSGNTSDFVVNPLLYNSAQSARTPDYLFLIAPMTVDMNALSALADMHFDDTLYIRDTVMVAIERRGEAFDGLGKVFLYVGLGLAVFSILLMGNFITATVSSQKREIGVLRAMGAKTSDVFAIFYSESLIVSIVNFVLSALVAGIVSMILNARIAGDLMVDISFMSYGIRQIVLTLILSVGASSLSSLLSVYSIAKRKPMDCILDK